MLFRSRIPAPAFVYYGREVWEQALAALLCGENLLLAGGKATGKNVLAESLAAAFGRPAWDISFHVNMDAASLIGMDTFEGGQVKFRPGPVYRCAQSGGFGVQDEINMAKNEALAVLHAVLDIRRAIDVEVLVDGELAATKMIAVSAGSFRVVTIPLTLDAGEHVITVGGMTANLTVE